MVKKIVFFLIAISSLNCFAQNPITPAGTNLCDPSPHVFSDGKLYLFTSYDHDLKDWTSTSNWAMSTSDLETWEIHEDVFRSAGANDKVSYNNAKLWAPDCIEKDGKFYFYYSQPDINNLEGVAVGESPIGPFSEGKRMELYGKGQIDPAVFVDDDGQAYYVWGQFNMKIAKLNPDMMSIDESSLKDSVLTEAGHYFHEGPFMTKRNGIYYLVFADISRAGMPTCIGYATSKNPMGPYKYGGVIVDNDHSDPEVWNNHGGIVEFNGQWYVLYHRSSHGIGGMRRACIEPIYFDEDGSIPEVEMTSQGAGKPLNAFEPIEAERACLVYGQTRLQQWNDHNEEMAGMINRDRAAFKYIDFGHGKAKKVEFKVKPGKNSGKILINIDKSWHKRIAMVEIPASNGKDEWITVSANIEKVEGIQELWFTFLGDGENIFAIDKFVFK